MHEAHDNAPDVSTLPGHTTSPLSTASTLFTADEDDHAKRDAIDRSIAAHHALAALPGVRFATDQTIVIVLHPGFELLDVVGPFHFLTATGATVHLSTTGDTLDPVPSGSGVTLTPSLRLSEIPASVAVLLVPGGDTGILLRDANAIAELRRLGAGAEYVTSVCSGSIALAAAGLLEGRRATSHWSVRHLLAGYGAVEVDERVVEDGNRLTAAGVTAGMDLGIRIVAYLCGGDMARFAVLGAEYAPEPPFSTGTPKTAGMALTDLSRDFLAPLVEELRAQS